MSPVSPPLLHAWLLINDMFFISLHLCMGMDEAHALVRALWNSSVSRVSILYSMFQCFHFLVGRGHARGMRLGTRPVYDTCGVAFVPGVTSAAWCCPKTYTRKQCNGVIQNNTLLLQIASNKHAPARGIKRKNIIFHS